MANIEPDASRPELKKRFPLSILSRRLQTGLEQPIVEDKEVLSDPLTRSHGIVIHGRQPANLNAQKVMADTRAPIDWHEQRAGLGFI